MKLFTSIFIIFFSLSMSAQSKYVLDKVVGQVGSEVVLLSDVQARISYLKDSYGEEITDEITCYIYQDLMAQKLLVNQAKVDSIEVSQEEVDQQINSRLERILATFGNDEQLFEENYGKSINEVRIEQQTIIRDQLYSEKMRAMVTESVQATPAEVKEFYNSIPSDSLPYFNSEVEYSELEIKPEASIENVNKSRDQLIYIRERLISGETSFEKAASVYSDDKESAKVGGDLGWQKRGTFVPEFEGAAFKLEPGEYSEIVESEFGFHLIQLIDRRGNLIHTRHILITPEITIFDLDSTALDLTELKSKVENGEISFELLVREYGNDKVQSFSNGGRVTNPQTGTTFFEVGQLESDVFFAIDDLEVGQVSDPVQVETPRGETVYKIFYLNSRSNAHKADLELDYPKIQQMATEQKKGVEFNSWLFQKIKQTYVNIDPFFKECEGMEIWEHKGNPID